jgi:HEPN domain-containing protein
MEIIFPRICPYTRESRHAFEHYMYISWLFPIHQAAETLLKRSNILHMTYARVHSISFALEVTMSLVDRVTSQHTASHYSGHSHSDVRSDIVIQKNDLRSIL